MGSSKKVTIGYKYFFGIHMGLFRGPLDALLQIKVGDRVAWSGKVTENRRIYINKPKLFGGDKKEGGIQGYLDVMMGAPDQPVNSRLAAMLGGIVPAFRGVATLFYDGLVSAMNPYPKPWAIRARRILKGWDGPVWYPEKAQIVMVPQKPLALYFALDSSGSMDEMTGNGQTRRQNMQEAIRQCLDAIAVLLEDDLVIDIMLVGWGTEPTLRSSILRRAVDTVDIDDLKDWVGTMTYPTETYFPAGVMDMPVFFSGASSNATRLAFFVTDGEPWTSVSSTTPEQMAQLAANIVAGVDKVAVHGINIDLEDTTYTAMVDNTSDDGVPVVAGDDPSALVDAIMSALGSVYAMNPAHIIYESYTNSDWGRGLDASIRIDLESFSSAADAFYAERFGLCIKWTRQDKLSAFVGSILDHVGGAIHVSRRTGKLMLHPIRGDYDIDDLPLFSPDEGLLGIDDEDAGADDKAINCVVVKYRDPVSNETLQVRARNLAGITTHGLNQQTVEYPGLPAGTLAARVAQRDLTTYSSGGKKLKVRLDRRARGKVFPGSVFRISDPARGIENLVLRAGRVEDGLLTSGAISVAAVKDVFGLPSASYVEPVLPDWAPPDQSAKPIIYQRLAELPYRDLVRITSPAELAYVDDSSAFLLTLASKPTAMSLGYAITSRVGTAGPFLERSPGDFVASAPLLHGFGLGADSTMLDVVQALDLSDVTAGMAAMVDDEIMRVDVIDVVTGAVTFGRGCVDTVPATHLSGARVWFYEDAVGNDATEYISGSMVQARLLTQTGAAELPSNSAATLTLALAGRPARPYPPGRLRLNGEVFPDIVNGDLVVTFAHRDRLLQADQLVDTAATDIGPEPGTTYEVEIRDRTDDALMYSVASVAGPITISSADMPFQSRLLVYAVRDGLRSWQAARADFEHGNPLWTPSNLTVAPKMWFDGSSAVTEVSGRASQWNDLGAGGFHLMQGSASQRPLVVALGLGGRRTLRFDGTNDVMVTTASGAREIMRNAPAGWMLSVYKKVGSDAVDAYRAVMKFARGINTDDRFVLNAGQAASLRNVPSVGVRRLDADSYVSLGGSASIVGEFCMVLVTMDWQNRTGRVWVNGSQTAESTTLTTAGSTSNTASASPFCVGAGTEAGGFASDVEVAAALVGSGSLPSTDEINRLFGWAAWHWGLAGSLPIDHPYKSEAPTL